MKFKRFINEGMKEWNYIFRDTYKGAFTIKAASKKSAISKIKKEWGISEIPSNFFIWSDDNDQIPKGFEGYGATKYKKV
jgi:hypothetical protein